MTAPETVLFLTSCPLAWGGSEELWSGTALRMQALGLRVRTGRSERWPSGALHPRWRGLGQAGIGVRNFGVSGLGRAVPDAVQRFLPILARPVWKLRSLLLAAKVRLLGADLAVISQGQAFDGCFPICLPEVCSLAGVPYVLVCQKAAEIHWPDDGQRQLLRRCYQSAAAVFFVSEHNHRTVERQLGIDLPQAKVVRNPYMVRCEAPLPWPGEASDTLRLACVARMWPIEKAQDVLLSVLARAHWRRRPIELSFYGEGPMKQGLEEMARSLALVNVHFRGFADPLDIWKQHHALVLPSRAEGLPLVQVEAMMCGRPVIVADAGGTAEIMRHGEHGFLANGANEAAIDDALEQAWQRRSDWPAIGAAAAIHIRKLYPADPCAVFATELLTILKTAR